MKKIDSYKISQNDILYYYIISLNEIAKYCFTKTIFIIHF